MLLGLFLLVVCFGGICLGVLLGLQIQKYYYNKWFDNHYYFCCNKFQPEDDDRTASFETDLTDRQIAHLSCWERNMFSNDEVDDVG